MVAAFESAALAPSACALLAQSLYQAFGIRQESCGLAHRHTNELAKIDFSTVLALVSIGPHDSRVVGYSLHTFDLPALSLTGVFMQEKPSVVELLLVEGCHEL